MEITKENLELCISYNMNRDILGSCLFVLDCFNKEDYELLDKFDDQNSNKNALIVYKYLEKLKFLKQEKNNDKTIHFKLTTIGKNFIELIKTNKFEEKEEEVEDWIKDYINLFKTDKRVFIKTANNRSLGSSLNDVMINMRMFLQRYNYIFSNCNKKDVILKATSNYLNSMKKNNYMYAKDCYYFIMKQEGTTRTSLKSTLAAECENVINSLEAPEEENYNSRDKSVN
jgi:hypothetical protein